MLSAVTAFFIMALTKEQKKQVVEDLNEKIGKQKAMVFVDVKGLKAKELFGLREKLKERDCQLTVSKKTLLNIAFKENKIDLDTKKLTGQASLIFGFKDEIAPAKTVFEFLQGKDAQILGGFFEDKFIETEKVVELAKILSRDELLAKVVGSIKAPIASCVNVLQGNIRSLVYVLNSIQNNK